ncbi:MAG: GNAT family N-acetyltransferase [Anaerolineales bacterium]
MEQILLIEQLAMNAWPAEEVDNLDGWRLRWHRVPSRRVNSVWPNAWGGEMPLALRMQRVREFYLLRGQSVCYQICPAALPVGLDEVLEAQGFVKKSETAVQVAQLEAVVANSTQARRQGNLHIFEALTEAWLEAYCLVQEGSLAQMNLRREALSRVARQGVYGLVTTNDGEPAAVGRGVVEGNWLGVFGLATGETFRRQGYATAILGALSQWAGAHGVQQMYLQVMENNLGAKALYEKLGFATQYHYHYRELNLTS